MIDKIDLVLQGPTNEFTFEIVEHYLESPIVNNIIISSWEENYVPPKYQNKRVKILLSKDLENPGIGNRNRQIYSSLVGLREVGTNFTAKLRTDQKIFLNSLEEMFNFYNENKDRILSFEDDKNKPNNRICVASIFKPFAFHPCDHIFWGNRDDLCDMFSMPLDEISCQEGARYDLYTRPEAYIGASYCSKFNSTILKYLKEPSKYLADKATTNEAKNLSKEILDDIFKVFPRIHFFWPKHYSTDYYNIINPYNEYFHPETNK